MFLKSWDLNLKIRLFGETLFNLLYWMYYPFIAIYFSESLDNHVVGLLMTIPPLITMLGNIIGGNLADWVGRRKCMLLGAVIQTVMFVFFAVSDNQWISYISFIGIGLGGALYGPASDAMVADLAAPQDRRKIFATFITANNIGAVLGPALGAIFFFSYRKELLIVCAIVMLIYSIIIYLKINESMPNFSKKEIKLKMLPKILKSEFSGFNQIFRDRAFILYIIGGICAVIAIMQLDLYLAVYITSHIPAQNLINLNNIKISLSSTEILGWILGLNGLLFVLFVMPVTKWLEKWSDRNVFILSALLAGFGMFGVGLTNNIWLLFILTIIFTFGEIVRAPVIDNFVADYAPDNSRGKYMGASRLQFTFGRFLAPLTIFLSEWIQPLGIFSIILFFALFSAVFYIFLYKNIEIYSRSKVDNSVETKTII